MEHIDFELLQCSNGDCDRDDIVEFLGDMLNQLRGRKEEFDKIYFERILHGGSEVYVMRYEGELAGMITLSVLNLSSGVRGCIDDVVVSELFRGKRLGRRMIEFIETRAKELGVESLFLTSSPTRASANALYCKMDYVKKETNVYIKRLN